MRLRFVMALAAFAAFLLPAASRADENKGPSIIVKLKSIEGLLKDAKYIAELAGQGEQLKQVDEMLKSFTNEQGLGGIDMKRPIGLYGSISPGVQDSPVVILVPIADEKAFIQFLANFEIKPEKDKDGIYTVESIPNLPVPVTLYFRFENKYAYVTANDKANIDKAKLLMPGKVLGDDNDVLSIAAKIADMPDILKQIVLGQVDNILAEAKEKKEGEPEAMHKLKEKVAEFVGTQIKALLTDGESLTLRVGVDQAKEDIMLDAAFKAKDGTQLAKDMVAAGKSQSLFAGIVSPTDAISAVGSITVPEELKKALGPAVDEMVKQVVEQEKDQVKQALIKAAMEKIVPTLKAGEIDGGASVRGPDKNGHYTIVGGIRVKEGKGIEGFVRDAIKNMSDKEREKIVLDSDSVGDTKIHKVIVDDMDAATKKVIGASTLYLAMRDDAAIIGMGPDALKAVKDAVVAKPGTASVMNIVVSVARAAGMSKEQANAEQIAKAVKEVFGSDPKGKDTVTLSAELTQTLKLKVVVKGKVIEFGSKTAGIAEGAIK